MKYEIPQERLDKIVFRYLDNELKDLERATPYYYEGIVFRYPDKEHGVLGWEKKHGFLFIYTYLIREISSNFGLDDDDSKELIGRWVKERLRLEVKTIYSSFISYLKV